MKSVKSVVKDPHNKELNSPYRPYNLYPTVIEEALKDDFWPSLIFIVELRMVIEGTFVADTWDI